MSIINAPVKDKPLASDSAKHLVRKFKPGTFSNLLTEGAKRAGVKPKVHWISAGARTLYIVDGKRMTAKRLAEFIDSKLKRPLRLVK